MTAWELASPQYFEWQVDPADEMDPAERTRLALARYEQQVREAEAELSKVSIINLAPDDWSWESILARVKAAAEDRSRTTGTAVPAGLILSAAELVDLLIEGAAQANVRDVDLAAFVNLPAVALAAVGEAWSHVAERVRE